MKKSFILLWVGVAALLIFFWVYFPGVSRYRDLKIQEEALQDEVEDLNTKIKALTDERNLLKNDVTYLEKVIREELGLVKPGEIVYKFVNEPAPEDSELEVPKPEV